MTHMGVSASARYRLLRWTLVRLRRVAVRHSINFDNAVESSAKDQQGVQHAPDAHPTD